MGWFRSDKHPGVMLGDEPFDIAYDFLKVLAEAYRRELGRGPSIEEVEALLETSLRVNGGAFVHEFEDQIVTQLTIKTGSKRKDQKFAVGDTFAVPLGGGRFAFGRIMDISPTRGVLVEIFDETGQGSSKADAPTHGTRLFHPFYVAPSAWKEWTWVVVSSDQEYRPKDLNSLAFAMGTPSTGWRITQGGRTREVEDEEIEGVERLIVWDPEDAADRIRDALS